MKRNIYIVCKLRANTVVKFMGLYNVNYVSKDLNTILTGHGIPRYLDTAVLNKTFGCNLYPRLRCVHRYGVTGYRFGNVSVTRGVTRATP
jgi:hypothetical protein